MAAVPVRELELDLDAFEGPFDLLLSLVLREELPLAELDLAQIVVAFVSRLDFDQETTGFSRIEVAVAFLALLELRKAGEVALSQAVPFAPIRISRAASERSLSWTAHSA